MNSDFRLITVAFNSEEPFIRVKHPMITVLVTG